MKNNEFGKGDAILKRLGQSLEKEDLADVKALIEELEISCPLSGSKTGRMLSSSI